MATRRNSKADGVLTLIPIHIRPFQLHVMWFPTVKASEMMAQVFISSAFEVKHYWEQLYHDHMPKKRALIEVGVLCEGLSQAQKKGFDEEAWLEEIEHSPMPVYSLPDETESGKQVFSLILTDEFKEYEPTDIAVYAITQVALFSIARHSNIKDPTVFIDPFIAIIKKQLKKHFRRWDR